jgi:multidrug resistance protein MdtO
MAQPLASEVAHSVAAIVQALTHAPALTPKEAKAGRHLISAGAVRDPETTRFALKVTLAVMLSYAAESLLNWPAIHTCVVT